MDPANRWIIPTITICLFGFIKEIRPVEPFLTPFLLSKNLSESEIENRIYPFWTYSYAATLIPVFILTDLVRYKPVIVAEGLALVASGIVMIFGYSVGLMQLMQCFYGIATAADIGYFAYLYAVVPPEKYQAVSSYTRVAYLAGGFLSSVLGQVFVTYDILTYAGLNILGTVTVSIATLIGVVLPRAKKSLFFHQSFINEEANAVGDNTAVHPSASEVEEPKQDSVSGTIQNNEDAHNEQDRDTPEGSPGASRSPSVEEEPCCPTKGEFTISSIQSNSVQSLLVLKQMWREFLSIYSDWNLLQWSLWWSVATCGYYQIGNYVQNLWDLIYMKQGMEVPDNPYYGAVEAASTLLGAISSFLIMYVKTNWDIYGEFLMGVVSVLDGILIFTMSLTTNIWVAFVNYIIFRASYQVLITIASFQIAKFLTVERYALVFGWNTFVALVLETLLTLIVVDSHVLNSPADLQFMIYGAYFGALGSAFLIKACFILYRECCRNRNR
ncbi:thiamine transporter 2-like [Apostichopus japonicus]|uniref:thiamine transporter 2-like n=1 Tax=Stichopus japonicus TaxID=307972 RepID=UPI003AB13B51